MVSVKIRGLSKSYDGVEIISELNWDILEGELMILLGPSGCGKTTLLKLILGALNPNNGNIYFNDNSINELSIARRNVGFVAQNFGLFPHLNVRENIAYGLKIRKISNERITLLIKNFIDMLKLKNLELRMPKQLSWGQQQRVALARALIIEPNLLLLDEPLSAVDWAARREITDEIQRMQKELEITTVYVTHDINEAFEIGDKIAVMNTGKIQQCDTAENIIKNPLSEFVSSYISRKKIRDWFKT